MHICQRWRNLAFTSPRHLNLQILCRPPYKKVEKMLDIWPELPIYIHDFQPRMEARNDVIAALKLNHRVSRIRLENTSESAPGPLIHCPFPMLTHLWIRLYFPIKNIISPSFLGGSAPSLRDLHLVGIPFPALPELLLSATNLVCLSHDNIPPSGYIPPQAMVTGLLALTWL